jgi:hypothetical protein
MRARSVSARARLGVAGVLVDADQDVARLILGDQTRLRLARIARLHQTQELEAARAADRSDHLADRHAAHEVGERRWDLVERTPAEVAAFQRVGAVRIAHGGGREIHLAALDEALDALDLLLAGGHLLGRRILRQRDQDVREPVLAAGGLLLLERGVDFGVADGDPALREALAQALDQHLVAHRGAEFVERRAVARELLAQLLHGDAVLGGDAGDRLVDLRIGDADAALLRAPDLQLDQHQPLQHLTLEHLARRQLGLAPRVLLEDVGDRAVELAAQHHVLVDHGDDAVDRLGLLLGGRGGGEQQQRGEETREECLHGSGSEVSSTGPRGIDEGGTR